MNAAVSLTSPDAAALEDIGHQLDAELQAMSAAASDLEAGWESSSQEITNIHVNLPDVTSEVHALEQAWTTAVVQTEHQELEHLAQDLTSVLHALHAEAQAAHSALSPDSDAFETASSGVLAQFGHAAHDTHSQGEKWLSTHDHLMQVVATLAARTAQHCTMTADSVTACEQAVAEHTSQLSTSLEQCCQTVTAQATQAVVDLVQAGQQQIDQIHSSVETSLRQACDDSHRQITQALQHLTDHISQSASTQLQQECQKLLDDCVAQLADEAAELIADATIGATVTAALGEFLPELIAVYKATEAIKAAIEALHDIERLI
jgi:hypothetical protein